MDLIYRMTYRDVTESDQDLMIRASLELTSLPVFDLDIGVTPADDGTTLNCHTLNISAIEIFAGPHYLVGRPSSNEAPTDFVLPAGLDRVEVRGFSGDKLVERTTVTITRG